MKLIQNGAISRIRNSALRRPEKRATKEAAGEGMSRDSTEAAATYPMVRSTMGPANEVAPNRSCQTLMTLEELHPKGFQTAIGDSNSRLSWPIAMASTA